MNLPILCSSLLDWKVFALFRYARPLVDIMDAENLFKFRVFRPSTISAQYREQVRRTSRAYRMTPAASVLQVHNLLIL
ncbi:hypothetical protein LINPERPRIM_LOCUS10126 [Linum perenne]